jgi:hypothetical protein
MYRLEREICVGSNYPFGRSVSSSRLGIKITPVATCSVSPQESGFCTIHLPLGVNSNGRNAEFTTGFDDSAGNLSTVGDEDLANGLSLGHRVVVVNVGDGCFNSEGNQTRVRKR